MDETRRNKLGFWILALSVLAFPDCNPIVQRYSAAPANICPDDTVHLSWQTRAPSVTITRTPADGPAATGPGTGSLDQRVTGTTTFRISARLDDATESPEVTVTVTPPPRFGLATDLTCHATTRTAHFSFPSAQWSSSFVVGPVTMEGNVTGTHEGGPFTAGSGIAGNWDFTARYMGAPCPPTPPPTDGLRPDPNRPPPPPDPPPQRAIYLIESVCR
jgi:hypothetical protein